MLLLIVFCVSATIELNYQLILRAVKINDVLSNHMLPSKFTGGQLFVSQQSPQALFVWGGIVAQSPAAREVSAKHCRLPLTLALSPKGEGIATYTVREYFFSPAGAARYASKHIATLRANKRPNGEIVSAVLVKLTKSSAHSGASISEMPGK